MKKRILIIGIALLAFVATFAICQAVTGNNWVGYVKVEVERGQYHLFGANFEAVGGGDVQLSELLSTNSLVASDIRLLADRFFIWNNVESEYEEFWYASDGIRDIEGLNDPYVYKGQAFWFKAAPSADDFRELFIMGQVSLSETNSLSFDGDTAGKFNLFANPYPVDFNVSSNSWENATPGPVKLLADRIFIWDGQNYQDCWLKNDGNWYVGDTQVEPVIPVGNGAWYKALNNFDEEVGRPFDIKQ